jgi:hypothetical protein
MAQAMRFVVMIAAMFALIHGGVSLADSAVGVTVIDSGPAPLADTGPSVYAVGAPGDVVLPNVPTSTWTYGCSATSAGMIFGYYDRMGYANMYSGGTNSGVAPLTDLGQGTGTPISGSCSIIATQNNFDGRTTRGHVDDYWVGYQSPPRNPDPDPWVTNGWSEHTWGDCTADYMGTNQWKWDFQGGDGVTDFNTDGSTALFTYASPTKLYDYIPPAAAGLPRTALCHGLRLFAESRGYSVVHDGSNYQNYTQRVDTGSQGVAGGFSFADYMTEIDNGRPVMVQVQGHSMVGVGYNSTTANTIILHDTWDNLTHTMTWGGNYAGMDHVAMTVIQLNAPVAAVSSPVNFGDVIVGAAVGPQTLSVSETGGLSPLDYQLDANPSGFAVTGAGSSHSVAAGGTNGHSVALNTGTIADYSGTTYAVKDTAVDDPGTTPTEGPNTLGTATLNARVLDHCAPTHTVTPANVNLGTVVVGAPNQVDNTQTLANTVHPSGLRCDLEVITISDWPPVVTCTGTFVGDKISQGTSRSLTFTGTPSTVGNHSVPVLIQGHDDTSLPGAAVAPASLYHVSFTVLDHAVPTATNPNVNLGTVIVGAPDQVDSSATFGNQGRGDGLRADLEVTSLTGLPAGIVSLSGLNVGDKIAQGSSQTLTFTGHATTVGNHCTLTVNASDDTALPGAAATAPTQYNVGFTVLDHSDGSFSGAVDQNKLVLDFGTFTQGAACGPLNFDVYNISTTPGFTCDLDLNAINGVGHTGVLTTDLALFAGLAEGLSNSYQAFFDTSSVGSFSATYTLVVADDGTLPGSAAGANLDLELKGIVTGAGGQPVPEPSALMWVSLSLLGWRRRRR